MKYLLEKSVGFRRRTCLSPVLLFDFYLVGGFHPCDMHSVLFNPGIQRSSVQEHFCAGNICLEVYRIGALFRKIGMLPFRGINGKDVAL